MGTAKWLSASAAGVAAAYFFDPRSGRRRRASLREKIPHATHEAASGLAGALDDLEHRAHGFVSRARATLAERELDDATLVARVRSRLGRVSRSVHDVCVTSKSGVVELTGHVFEDEAETVLRTARSTRGVRGVVDALERRGPESAPLAPRRPAMARRRRGYWTPATRLVVGASAVAAAAWGLYRGGAVGAALASLGAAGVWRSACNRSIGELAGLGRPSRGIDIQKTITIRAPVDEVYRCLTEFESFPRFMRHVESVERLDDNRWRFVLKGPVGRRLELDGVLLEVIPNELVSWTTADESPAESTGSARFERMGTNETRVTIRMTYRPRAGLLPHEIAALFHADLEHEIGDDIRRSQSLLGRGSATRLSPL